MSILDKKDIRKSKNFLALCPQTVGLKVSLKFSEKNNSDHFSRISFMKGSHLLFLLQVF